MSSIPAMMLSLSSCFDPPRRSFVAPSMSVYVRPGPHDSARKRRPCEISHGPGGSAETDRATDPKRRCSHQEGLRAQLGPLSCSVRISLVGRSDELDGSAPAGSREPRREAVETRTGRRQESSRNADQRCHDLQAYLREVLSRVADIRSIVLASCLPGTSALTQLFAPEPDESQGPVRFCWRSAAAKHRRTPHAH
jgi:hypothetical protein